MSDERKNKQEKDTEAYKLIVSFYVWKMLRCCPVSHLQKIEDTYNKKHKANIWRDVEKEQGFESPSDAREFFDMIIVMTKKEREAFILKMKLDVVQGIWVEVLEQTLQEETIPSYDKKKTASIRISSISVLSSITDTSGTTSQRARSQGPNPSPKWKVRSVLEVDRERLRHLPRKHPTTRRPEPPARHIPPRHKIDEVDCA